MGNTLSFTDSLATNQPCWRFWYSSVFLSFCFLRAPERVEDYCRDHNYPTEHPQFAGFMSTQTQVYNPMAICDAATTRLHSKPSLRLKVYVIFTETPFCITQTVKRLALLAYTREHA